MQRQRAVGLRGGSARESCQLAGRSSNSSASSKLEAALASITSFTTQLAELVDTELRALALLVERAYTPHMVLGGREELRRILRVALDSGDEQLATQARETISRLYALRHTECSDLID
jgi:hypothetical protein